jgi:hypothetical protein
MKKDHQDNGRRHDHNDVWVKEYEHSLRVSYKKMSLVINYPYSSIEKWEIRKT